MTYQMKRKTYLLLGSFLVLSIFSAYAQCGGVIASKDTVITCGGSTMMNAEPSWSKPLDSLQGNFRSVFFVNSAIGYTVGVSGTIRKTTDGGASWITQSSGTSYTLSSVFFTDLNTGYIVGSESGQSKIFKTIDAGATWVECFDTMLIELNSLHFINANTGFAVGGNGTLLKTIDAGNTWIKKATNTTQSLARVYFPSATIGYACGGPVPLKTTDGGETWFSLLALPVLGLNTIYFTDNNTGYTAGVDRIIFKTTDGGNSWSSQLFANLPLGITTLYFTDANTGYAGSAGNVLRTTDAGNTWVTQSVNVYATGMHFPDAKTGYIAGNHVVKFTVPDLISWTPATGLSSTTVANPIASPMVTTKYKITTTAGSCTATDSVTIKVDPFEVNAGNDKILSCGNTVQLDPVTTNYTGTGNLTYSWSPTTGLNFNNTANPTVTIKQTLTYTVTVTTPNGCTSSDTVKVLVGPLSADAGADRTITCGEEAQLGVSTNYTGGGLTYAWTPAAGLNLSYVAYPEARPLKTTTYFITITTPNGCTAKDSVTVIVNPLKADAGIDKTIICGGAAQLEVLTNYKGSNSLTYTWSPTTGLSFSNIANPTASVVQNTIFIVTVATQNGCTSKDTVNVLVNPLVADAGADITMTCGSEQQLQITSNYTGSASLTYSWLPASGLNFSNIYNPIVNVAKTTKFYVTVKTPYGCQSTDSITVNVNPLTVNAGSDKTHICGGSVQLDSATTNYSGNGTLTYIWLPKDGLNNSSIPNPISSSPGVTYTLTISSPFGACIAKDQVNVGIAPLDGTEICLVTVDSTSRNTIIWDKVDKPLVDSFLIYKETAVAGVYTKLGSVSKKAPSVFRDMASKPNVSSNKYKVSLKDTCGVETALSSPHKTIHVSINKGLGTSWNLVWEGYEGFPVSSYIIYKGTSNKNLQFLDATSGANNQYTDVNVNPPAGDVYYQLEIIRSTPCNPANPMNNSRSNIAASNEVGVGELSNGFNFSVYPNPSAGAITVELETNGYKNNTLNIYNAIGALVKSIPMDENKQQLDVSNLSNGFYTIELRSGDVSAKQKLTIQR
jgi:photosystem II stability/assembly factor-like uncharacterized protein